jgi:iron complex transport system ATP-binding protein
MTLAAETLRVRLGDKAVLGGVSCAFEPGKVTCVVGPNGAGKSTLLSCLAGLRTPDSGQALLDGRPLASLSPRERARRIGFLPQVPEIAWAVDSATLVGLGRIPHVGARGLGEEDQAAVTQAMGATDTTDLAGRIVETLSGGERARVLIARVLAGKPRWILADEPMAGLDPGHVLDAAELLKARAHQDGCGVILTLHDLSVALRLADRVIVLARGAIVAEGPPVDALGPEAIAKAYGVIARIIDGAAGPMLEVVGRSG